jgi:hypothetical protein
MENNGFGPDDFGGEDTPHASSAQSIREEINNNAPVNTDVTGTNGSNGHVEAVELIPARKPGTFRSNADGGDPRRNTKGRPAKIAAFENMLNRNHRNMEAVTALFERLRALALGEVVAVPYVSAAGDVEYKVQLKADPAFMKLYLERILGLPQQYNDDLDLSDAPQEVLAWLRRKVQGA